jgi:hypothetical protein
VTKAPPVIIADFETKAIEPRPKYPPKPVSLALKWPDRCDYLLMAWGHGDGSKAAGNNCTEKEARGEYAGLLIDPQKLAGALRYLLGMEHLQ